MLALASPRDQYHARAARTAAAWRRTGGRWVGTTLVLGELHGHLIRRIAPARAAAVIEQLIDDPIFEWRDVTVELTGRAVRDWLQRFSDQPFSLTDAVTFAVMREERLTRAFAFDQDFATAGFDLLP